MQERLTGLPAQRSAGPGPAWARWSSSSRIRATAAWSEGFSVGRVGDFGPDQDELDLAGDDLVLQSLLGTLELGGAGGQHGLRLYGRAKAGTMAAAATRAITVALLGFSPTSTS